MAGWLDSGARSQRVDASGIAAWILSRSGYPFHLFASLFVAVMLHSVADEVLELDRSGASGQKHSASLPRFLSYPEWGGTSR